MSVTLGLNFNHADSSACLFIDNSLKFAVEEERINRIKHWAEFHIILFPFAYKKMDLSLKISQILQLIQIPNQT